MTGRNRDGAIGGRRRRERERERHPSFPTHSDILRVLRAAACPHPRRIRSPDSPHHGSPSSTLPSLGSLPLSAPSYHLTLPPPFHDLGTWHDRRGAAPASNLATETPLERGGQQRSRRLAPLCGRKRAPLVGRRGVVNARVRVAGECTPLVAVQISPTSLLSSLLLRPHCDGTCSVLLELGYTRIFPSLSRPVRCNTVGREYRKRVRWGGINRIRGVGDRRLRRRQHALRAIHAANIPTL